MDNNARSKEAAPAIMGIVTAGLVTAAFVRGASAWIDVVILLGWWAGILFYQRFFEEH
jgi:hypothetical protein